MVSKHIEAFWYGFKDGWDSPDELTCGMTYANQTLNETYDHGVNYGQWVRAIYDEIKHGPIPDGGK